MNPNKQDLAEFDQVIQAQADISSFALAFVNASENKPDHGAVILDSLTVSEEGHQPKLAIPDQLKSLFAVRSSKENGWQLDSLVGIGAEEKSNLKSDHTDHILRGLSKGIEGYKKRNGGDMPSAGLIASAMLDAAHMLDELKVNADSSAHIAAVPALTLVTIASRIANGLPIVAMLPNPIGSNTLPLINVRHIAKNDRGHFNAGDYIDGDLSPAQFIDSYFEFLAETANDTTFKVLPKVKYQTGTQLPDANSLTLPFVRGGVNILVNGVLVASDNASASSTSNTATLIETPNLNLKLKNGNTDVLVKIANGSINYLTSEIEITFANALPDDVDVTATVFADYERENNGVPVIQEPALNIITEKGQLNAYEIRSSYTATIGAITQMQNELGVDVRAALIALVTGKLILEQNMRLLSRATRVAKAVGLVYEVDISRGNDMTSAFNNTRDQSVELIPGIKSAVMGINNVSNHAANGYDIYLSGHLSILMDILPDDTRFVPTNAAIGANNQIVRIGTLQGNINVYSVPETQRFKLFESGTITLPGLDPTDPSDDITVSFAEMLLVARNSEAAKSIFVGHTPCPVIAREYLGEKFKSGVTYFARQCAEINPIPQYATQAAVIRVLNLPKSLQGKVAA